MLKKLFLFNFMFVLCFNQVFAYSDDELSYLEHSRYGRSFEYEALSERLSRLETDVFGMAQAGDVETRIYNLSKMSKNSRSVVNYPEYASPENKKRNVIRNLLNNVSSVFESGVITGFTPSMSSYGYSDNIYDREFNNYINNPPQYCPYHNRYYPQNPFYNNYTQPMPPVNYYSGNTNYPHGYPHNSYRYYPNYEATSSVHIIRN